MESLRAQPGARAVVHLHSPYATAFFTMAERLGIVPGGEEVAPSTVLADMQADEQRAQPEYLKARARLADALRQRRESAAAPANGAGGYPAEERSGGWFSRLLGR